MAEHAHTTPVPWVEVGAHDIRGANMHLVGMVNPTVVQGLRDRAFIVRAVNAHDDLVKALEIFLGHDERFQIAVGGNPNAIDKMMEAARAALTKAKQP